MDNCGIYFAENGYDAKPVHNANLVYAQNSADNYNATLTEHGKPGRYIVGPLIDFLNGPAAKIRGFTKE